VTAAAVEAELTIVDVVGSVAASAISTDALHFIERASVAIRAGDFDVCPGERESGLNIVVK
jgi:hypothetical protein